MIRGSGRSLAEGHGNPLQDSCLKSSMDRRAWWATVHGIKESDITERLILMFIAALFTVAKTWKQLKCPLTGG